MSEREYAVRVIDSAPGHHERIEPAGNRTQAEARAAYWRAIGATRGTYGIAAKVVFRYSFMPNMPWEDA